MNFSTPTPTTTPTKKKFQLQLQLQLQLKKFFNSNYNSGVGAGVGAGVGVGVFATLFCTFLDLENKLKFKIRAARGQLFGSFQILFVCSNFLNSKSIKITLLIFTYMAPLYFLNLQYFP